MENEDAHDKVVDIYRVPYRNTVLPVTPWVVSNFVLSGMGHSSVVTTGYVERARERMKEKEDIRSPFVVCISFTRVDLSSASQPASQPIK